MSAHPAELESRAARGATVGAIAGAAVAVSTTLVTIAAIVLLFFNPLWVGFEQERAGADRLTGYPLAEVRRVTDSMIAEVYFGPGTFEQQISGATVLDARERAHMADVRTVVGRFLVVAALGVITLAAGWIVGRRRRWFWRGLAAGSATLLGVGVVVGLAVTVAFDAAFELFHEAFFPPGSFDFDPRTERLVQIFPEQLFDETGFAVAVVGFVVSVGVLVVARRRIRSGSPWPG